jgi:hypothetical protein
MNLELLGNRVCACLILHNMCVSDCVMGGDVRASYNPFESLVEMNNETTITFENPPDLRTVQGNIDIGDMAQNGVGNGEPAAIALVTSAARFSSLQ